VTDRTDLLVLAPHPDDAEICCGGLILQLTDAGRTVVMVDMTRGEKGSFGTPHERAAECEAATRVLGVRDRRNLGLPDAALRDDEPAARAVVEVLRAVRPAVVAAPPERDLHPDHAATGQIAARAWFLAGLRNVWPELGAPFRPAHLLRYPMHDPLPPTFVIDITAVAERKLAAVRCYDSQIRGASSLRARLDPLERAAARDRYFGAGIGKRAGEPYAGDGPLALRDISCLL
jgi:bacillithiol biosynthesis deacetylase BshB1